MNAVDEITRALLAADHERPSLRVTNTALADFELLALALKKAGAEFAFVGKTDDMDGGKVYPQGFTPVTMTLIRPDGQQQVVTIRAVSMDAAWHVPTRRQIKVIVNSTANDDPRPEIHGPAKLTPYEIAPEHYRWHNPAIAQSLLGIIPDVPQPQALPEPPRPSVLPKGEAFAALTALNNFYAAPEGLNRPGGMMKTDDQGRSIVDTEAVAQWFYQLVIERVSLDAVKAQIRLSDEWRGKHP